MTAVARPAAGARAGGFGRVLHAEWTKLRTVRGWLAGLAVAGVLTAGFGLLFHAQCGNFDGACTVPLGPGGEAVADTFYFVHQPLAGNGSLTVRVTSLSGLVPSGPQASHVSAGQANSTAGMRPGLEPWAKAGIIIKAGTRPGSAYAAIMVTGGHGVRMQADFTGDEAGLPGAVSAASPRWLRLSRAGQVITGYDSADGTHWQAVGTVRVAGLPRVAAAGLFAASPQDGSGAPTLATGTFDRIAAGGGTAAASWQGGQVGGPASLYPAKPGQFTAAGTGLSVTGSGDIAPDVPGTAGSMGIDATLIGAYAGLIAIAVVASAFAAAEYRRGLIRATLAATPRRGRVLAAKALVAWLATFAVSLAALAVAVPLGLQHLRANGNFVDPVPALTELRVEAGLAALLALAAVLALSVATVLRNAAAGVVTVIVLLVAPAIVADLPSSGPAGLLLRLTPAAGFSVTQAYPRWPQVSAAYSAAEGYYPLAPWAGFAVLCAWTAAALALAAFGLRRRDA